MTLDSLQAVPSRARRLAARPTASAILVYDHREREILLAELMPCLYSYDSGGGTRYVG